MKSIELSTMLPAQGLGLDEFAHKTLIHVNHHHFDWQTGWNSILPIALYQKGPEVSEVGSTWLNNLISMNALRPFRPANLRVLGEEAAFFSTLKAPNENVDHPVWSIPWLLDTRLIHYRSDLLSQAGVPEDGAFGSPEGLVDTLKRLQASGIRYPLLLATGANSLHILAVFIWGRGGDFRSSDLHKLTLLEPEARRGLLDYFSLIKFIDPQHVHKSYAETDPLYLSGQAAVTLSGQWLLQTIKNATGGLSEAANHTRYAPPPGVPYIGSTHLVTWRHSIHEEDTVQLICHLTSPEVYPNLTRSASIIPARKEVFNNPPFVDDPDYQLVARLLQRGRGFDSGKMWAGVEMRLTNFCEKLWQDLVKEPDLNLEAEIEQRLRELSTRVERTLLST